MMKQWSTAELPAPAQFEFWREIICNSFVPLRPERVAPRPISADTANQSFLSSLKSWEANDVFFGEVSGQEQWVYRGEHEISLRDRPVYFLNIQRRGKAFIKQGERETWLVPNSFAMVDASLPFQMHVSEDFEQLSIKIPKARLAHLLSDSLASPLSPIECTRGIGRLVVSAYEAIVEQSEYLDPGSSEVAIDQAMTLTAFALNQHARSLNGVDQRRSNQLLGRARTFLSSQLNDPNLSVHDLANHLELSVRYVQAIFAATGISVSQWILERRLDQCRQDLLRRDNSEGLIATVAFDSGFNDLSYFNRSFKRRFGITPSQCRKR
jgi:AraC family transcriptional regulator, positive regulator of tynA and feaB